MKTISNQPYKGTSDMFPEEFAIRKAIFDRWRSICLSYGYKEYLTPLVEQIEVYEAKSGEDLGGKELMRLTDRAGRELAIRPEMTPSVMRMVTRYYESESKPLRLFSIANFMRAEKPQRGRNREFWQLNYDIFGTDSILADVEVLQIALQIMLSFNPPKGSFVLKLNHREQIRELLLGWVGLKEEKISEIMRLLDKTGKLSEYELNARYVELEVKSDQIEKLNELAKVNDIDQLKKLIPNIAINEDLQMIMNSLDELGYGEFYKYTPNLIRGLDYYDGMVFEVFDNHPQNNRSVFGGGRYNGLASIFGHKDIPAVGCAPGDEALYLFTKSWDLQKELVEKVSKNVYIPLLDDRYAAEVLKRAVDFRQAGINVTTGVEVMKIGKAIAHASKSKYEYIALLGENEIKNNSITIKDLSTGEQFEGNLEDFVKNLKD